MGTKSIGAGVAGYPAPAGSHATRTKLGRLGPDRSGKLAFTSAHNHRFGQGPQHLAACQPK
jgi:hypothetical protein